MKTQKNSKKERRHIVFGVALICFRALMVYESGGPVLRKYGFVYNYTGVINHLQLLFMMLSISGNIIVACG